MQLFKKTGVLVKIKYSILISALLAAAATTSFAWDQHHYMTDASLKPLRNDLSEKVTIRSFEDYLKNAFPQCTQRQFFDRVMGGVGEHYDIIYVDHVDYDLTVSDDLFNVRTLLKLFPMIQTPNQWPFPEAIVPASQILSAYSDEPDWLIDVDVPALKDVGPARGIRGTGTQILRHFWYGPGERMNRGVETPYHTQRMLDLALASFATGERYWGYRFLAHVIHYVQDVTQPYHVKLIPTLRMVRKMELVNAALCEYIRDQRKKHPGSYQDPDSLNACNDRSLTLDQAVYLSGLSVMAYHIMYEAYEREILTSKTRGDFTAAAAGWLPTNPTEAEDVDHGKVFVERSVVPFKRTMTGFDVAWFLETISDRTRKLAFYVGYDSVNIFGPEYVDLGPMLDVLRTTFKASNPGYKLAHNEWAVTKKTRKSYNRLRGFTRDLIGLAGSISRQTVLAALHTPVSQQENALVQLRELCKP